MLHKIIDALLYRALGLDPASRLVQSLNFFVYDSLKIVIMLFLMITAVGFLRSYLPQRKILKWLSGSRRGIGNLFAAVFGAITPFCSCSSIPLFFSFLEAGIPLGITLSFLITSPLVNEYLVVIMLGLFGWKVTLAYVISGIMIGVVSGMVLGAMGLEKELVTDIASVRERPVKEARYATVWARLRFGLCEALSIVKKLWFWILVGVGVGALIHNFVPESFVQAALSASGVFSVPLAVLIGVPLYGSCAAIVPIALALFQKGLPLGTALAFMMAIAGLSLPEAIILRRAMKLKLLALFFAIVSLAMIITGYLFNLLEFVLV